MVNVGTGNMVLQADDMSVPHKGIALAFRRTYNAQSLHDASGDDGTYPYGTFPSMYGTGWTNTFDAHLARTADGTVWSVFDIDGARYDYSHVPNSYTWTPPPGQHATLIYDGSCGMLWTKKSGTTYYFYRPNASASCPSLAQVGGYAGRLYEIAGHNQNTALSFSYSWLNGDASATGKITQIDVTAESGLHASLRFGTTNGLWLLTSLTRPDGTAIGYGYDGAGNLTSVTLPPNNGTPPSFADGVAPVQTYGYESSGPRSYLAWAASPRWSSAPGGCSGDLKTGCGAYLLFRYAYGATPTTTSLTEIDRYGFMDPAPPDGTGTSIQPLPPGGSAVATAPALSQFYALGQLGTAATPTLRDSDGHATNWVTDASGRPTQTQECTTTQNQQCTGTVLTTGETWDAANEMTAQIDARGYETDYAYDVNGNTVEVGYPATTVQTSNGTVSMRPTKLFDYDSFNNVIAYCDERETHLANADWQGPSTSDSLCTAHAGQALHYQFSFRYPAYEPFGEQIGSTTPLGYARTISYPSGSADYGLPTSVTGPPIAQADSTSAAENATFGYDVNGNLTTYSTGSGTWQLSYDGLGRLLVATDPDGVSNYSSYWPDGSLAKSETAIQHAVGLGVLFARDYDGNVVQETHHYACTSAQTCTAGTTQKWYDGADRLVEVVAPQDPSDRYPFPWLTRYVYDLTQGGYVAVFGQSVRSYGTLFKTQEWLANTTPVWAEPNWSSQTATPPPALGSPSWTDVSGTAVDALDRTVGEYRETLTRSSTYDTSNVPGSPSNALGLLAQSCNGAGECKSFQYDERALVTQQAFSVSSSPTEQFTHDEDGRKTGASSANGTVSVTYDAEGRVASRSQAITSNGHSATIAYHYYADGKRSAVDVTTEAVAAPNALTYSYRSDGKMVTLAYTYGLSATWGFSYTNAGRMTRRADTVNATPTTMTYDTSNTGLLTGMTYPAGSNTSLSYDAEGELLSGVLPNNPYVNAYTRRGEALSSTRDATGTVVSYGFANGVMIPIKQSTNGTYWKPYTYGIDAIRGVPVDDHAINTCTQGNSSCGTDSGGDVSSNTQYEYDRAARQSGSTLTGPQSSSTGNASQGTVSKQYDAEDHLLEQDFANMPGFAAKFPQTWSLRYSYGPEGHPFTVGTTSHVSAGPVPTDFQDDSLFWDDDAMLFSEDAQGNIDDFKIGTLADFQPHANMPAGGQGPLLSVIDRDGKGQTLACHYSDGTAFAATSYGARFVANGVPCVQSSGTIGRGGILTMPKTDGLFDGWNTIQGVRSYDTQAAVWNTPDAYKGDVHDPMSQKPYMWNGNNPYQYSDPSGYCIGPLIVVCVWALANAPELIAAASIVAAEADGSGAGGGAVWSKGWAARGVAIENGLAKNTASSFPVIDRYLAGQGAAAASVTSIKSMDLGAASYQTTAGVFGKLKGYVDKVAGFSGAASSGRQISVDASTQKVLEIVIPNMALSASQRAGIDAAAQYATSKGVAIHVVIQ